MKDMIVKQDKIMFSLLMAVYDGDKPEYFEMALDSVANNFVVPHEIVLVQDGPIREELKRIIHKYLNILPIKLVVLPESGGLGPALQVGLKLCNYDWVARFDSDDICEPFRFQKQLEYIKSHPFVDAFSAPIIEFSSCPFENSHVLRKVPIGEQNLIKYAKWRNPFNHMSVMFRKAAVVDSGGYYSEPSFEDYSLWVRMIVKGYSLNNMDEVVVRARSGDAILERRGGMKYIKNELYMLRLMRNLKFISPVRYFISLILKLPIRLLPKKLRLYVYNNVMRVRK